MPVCSVRVGFCGFLLKAVFNKLQVIAGEIHLKSVNEAESAEPAQGEPYPLSLDCDLLNACRGRCS